MSEYVYNRKTIGKYTVRVVRDTDPMNPRTEQDNLCTMVCFHRRYNLGDMNHGFTPESIREYIKHKDVFSLPVYMYEHSGITINTTGFSCNWDSGLLGYIFIERKRFMENYGFKKMTKKAKEMLHNLLTCEVKEYDKYLTGDMYGYIVDDPEGFQISSCWNFYDQEQCFEEGISDAMYQCNQDVKNHIKKVKIWIKHKVPLDKREPLVI